MKKAFRILLKTILGIAGFILAYLLLAIALSSITVNGSFSPCDKDAVEVFVLSNGVHTDIVVPVRNEIRNWSTFIDPMATKRSDSLAEMVAFGWGDKGFYLETPTWAELKFSTAFKAMFFLSTSAMHVTFHSSLHENRSCRKICISKIQYRKLVGYIENSFAKDGEKAKLINGASYGDDDLFYDATGTYNLFFTCNTWANGGLKAAGLRACMWTPFERFILQKYE